MSTAVGIAATTQVLIKILDEAVAEFSATSSLVGNASTTALPPDRIVTGDQEPTHLNLFLYQVSYNPGWRDYGLPGRDSGGNLVSRPPLAVDLHYVLSAYSSSPFVGEVLLGLGMQALHESPILTRAEIANVFKPPATNSDPMKTLATANLGQQVELIKIIPQTITTEELSRLWTAFQGKYRLSAMYQASVVLIESRGPVKSTLPVRTRAIYVQPFQKLTIDSIEPPILPWSNTASIAINGDALFSPSNAVRFGSGDHQAFDTQQSSAGQLIVKLPATLPAGLNTVQVVQQLLMGAPPLRDVVESNVAAFLLQPVINNISVDPMNPGQDPRSTTITVQLDPVVLLSQKVTLLLDQLNPPAGHVPLAYNFDAPARVASTHTLTVPVIAAKGNYLLRVRVDGADSMLTTNANGVYNGPQVTL
jgi:hypothetical protein